MAGGGGLFSRKFCPPGGGGGEILRGGRFTFTPGIQLRTTKPEPWKTENTQY